jgi:hypothetical protein
MVPMSFIVSETMVPTRFNISETMVYGAHLKEDSKQKISYTLRVTLCNTHTGH